MSVIRINQLPDGSGTLTSDDIFLIMDAPSSTSTTKQVSANALRNYLFNQSASLQFRQGTDAERLVIVPLSGEPIWVTDTNSFYIGNGSISGGLYMAPSPYKLSESGITTISSNNSLLYSPDCSIVCGKNNSSSYYKNSSILGGYNNSIFGNYTAAVENGTYGTNSCIIGGINNILGVGENFDNMIIIGGYNNTISTSNSAILNGDNNSISQNNSVIIGGSSNNIGSIKSCIIGGEINICSASNSVILGGKGAKTSHFGAISHSTGSFANNGDAQHIMLTCRRSTTDATANTVLTLDGSLPSSVNRLTIPHKTVWNFTVKISAYNDTDSIGAGWTINGTLRRNSSNGTAILGTNSSTSWTDAGMSTASASVVADDTNEALEIRVTGIAAKNIRWSATIDINQVSYGTVL